MKTVALRWLNVPECLRFSTVDLVGLQVWRGALLLSDYILSHPHEFHDKEVLELAAGTGITSIVVSELTRNVTCTGRLKRLS
jgi:predicted nicotinamide N-methyase